MILRIPDYYDRFSCIADHCKGSCCAGWEIDIDEQARAYYSKVSGEIGDRMRDKLYQAEDGGYRFRLSEDGRCPFLNSQNLCDIIIALGPDALSEVCADFPRFAFCYGHVMQRVLSISCEEVGRILFSRREPVTYVERECKCGGADWEDEDTDEHYISFLEQVQQSAIALLQDRNRSLEDRVRAFLSLCEAAQNVINRADGMWCLRGQTGADVVLNAQDEARALEWRSDGAERELELYDSFDRRFGILEELEELGPKWSAVKRRARVVLTETDYARLRAEYMCSDSYDEIVYEQLLVYFTFRYLMQAVYSYDLLSYGRLAVSFTLMIRDLDILRWSENGGRLELEDRIDNAHIFSREVEHSEENFDQVREEFTFEG